MSLNKVYYILLKDLKVEIRRLFEILASISFVTVASLVIAQSAFKSLTPQLVVPALWVILIFIAIFTSTTTFTREADKKTLYGLKIIPVSPSIVFLSKTIFILMLMLFQGTIEILLLTVFSSQWYLLSPNIIVVFIILSVYVSAVAAFTSAIVMYSEGRSFLIPMLVLIFTAPIIPLAVTLSTPNIPFNISDVAMMLIEAILMLVTTSILSEYVLKV